MEGGPEASATESPAPDQSTSKENAQTIPVKSADHDKTEEVPNEAVHNEEEGKKEDPQESEPSKPLEKEDESDAKGQEENDSKTNSGGNASHPRRKRRRSGWTPKPKKTEKDEGTPLSAMLSGKAPVTYPLKINNWLEIVNLGEVLPDKSKAIITPWVGPKSRGKKLLWPVGFEARRKTVSYAYPGNATTYKCSVRTTPSESGADVPEYTISTDEDPSNPIVRNDPEEALRELKTRLQNAAYGVSKNFHFNEADAFFGISNTNVQTFIKRLPNYADVFQEYIDDDENGNGDEEDEAEQNGAEEGEQKREFDFLFNDYRRGRGRVYYGEDIISFEDDPNDVVIGNEGGAGNDDDDDDDDAYVPNSKHPKSSSSSGHGARSQKKAVPKKEKEKEDVPAPTEVSHEKDKLLQTASLKRARKKPGDKTDPAEPRRKVPELRWGEVYPDFGIVYLPNKLPNYELEKLIEINEEQNKQIRALNSEIAKTLQAISKLRNASDDWLSLEQSRIKDIINFDDGGVTK